MPFIARIQALPTAIAVRAIRFARLAVVLAVGLLAAGCVIPPEDVFGVDNAKTPALTVSGTRQHEIFIATTRQADPDPGIMFSTGRSKTLNFARVNVSVPPGHVAGRVERPKKLPPDPQTDFVVLDPIRFAGAPDLVAAIDAALLARPEADRTVLLFVHGYNTTATAAVMRIAQFVHDSGFRGVPVLFSWASRGKTVDYVYDMNSALQARTAFIETAAALSQTKAKDFGIVAHSMGNLLTVEGIRQAKLLGEFNKRGRVATVILASPDIDVDLFEQQIAVFPENERNFFILISRDDKALAVSRKIAGGVDRVGDAQASRLAAMGVTVIDLSRVSDRSSLNHTKFADSPEMVQLIGRRLNAGDQLGTEGASVTGERISTAAPNLKVESSQARVFNLGD
jgi:esterase/lipase superfamily enzyme